MGVIRSHALRGSGLHAVLWRSVAAALSGQQPALAVAAQLVVLRNATMFVPSAYDAVGFSHGVGAYETMTGSSGVQHGCQDNALYSTSSRNQQ